MNSGMYPSWRDPEELREEAGRVAHFPIYHYREWKPTLNLPRSHAPHLKMSPRMSDACRRMKNALPPPRPSLETQARSQDASTQRYFESAGCFNLSNVGAFIELAVFPVRETEIGVINSVDQWIDFEDNNQRPPAMTGPYDFQNIYNWIVKWSFRISQQGRYPLDYWADGEPHGALSPGQTFPVNDVPGGEFWQSYCPNHDDLRFPWYANANRKVFWIVPPGNTVRLFCYLRPGSPQAVDVRRVCGRLGGYLQNIRSTEATTNLRTGYR